MNEERVKAGAMKIALQLCGVAVSTEMAHLAYLLALSVQEKGVDLMSISDVLAKINEEYPYDHENPAS